MQQDFSRTERVGTAIQRELAVLIRDEIKDPRLGMVTVQGVEVTRDFSHAKVFVTVMQADKREQSLAVLRKAAGFLRRALGRSVQLRTVPELHFEYDTSIEDGARLYDLIEASAANLKPESPDSEED